MLVQLILTMLQYLTLHWYRIMSLDSNVADLATRIGEEIKDVRADMALISVGGGTQNVFIQETEPAVVVDSLWIQRLPNGNFTMWLKGV